MPDEELVTAYLDGLISRRTFVRLLVGTGLSLGTALGFARLLIPDHASAASPRDADVIFLGGTVLTMESDPPVAEALAIGDGRILGVGSEGAVLRLRGSSTRLIDLEGATLLPGFVDAHTHILNDAAGHGMTLDQAQQFALENGITAIGDLFVNPEFLPEIQAFAAAGSLRIRTSLYPIWDTNCGDVIGPWYSRIRPERRPDQMLRIPGIKFFTDGGSCGRPAVSFAYTDDGTHGDLWLTQDELNQAVAEAQGMGFQVAIHALGDVAIDQALNALETVAHGRRNLLRHRIEHNALLRPDQFARYGPIGVVPTIFGAWPTCTFNANVGSSHFPQSSWSMEWQWRRLLDANPGMRAAWSSDWPVLSMDPMTTCTDS